MELKIEEVREEKCDLLAETRGSRLLAIEGSGLNARNFEHYHGYLIRAERNQEAWDFSSERERACVKERIRRRRRRCERRGIYLFIYGKGRKLGAKRTRRRRVYHLACELRVWSSLMGWRLCDEEYNGRPVACFGSFDRLILLDYSNCYVSVSFFFFFPISCYVNVLNEHK